jgi:hypothetical protein
MKKSKPEKPTIPRRKEPLSLVSIISIAMAVLSAFSFCVLMGFSPILPVFLKYLLFFGMIIASFIGAGLGAVGVTLSVDPEKKGFSLVGIFLNAGVFLFLTLFTWSGHTFLQ